MPVLIFALLMLVGCSGSHPTSFLIISLDTFRADRLGRIGPDGRSLTPSLDALAAESVVFSRAYAPSNETLFSHAALFTGQPASQRGELDASTFQLSLQTPTLAGELSRARWRAEAIVAGGHLSPVFGLHSGFRRYVSMADWASLQQTGPEAVDRLMWLSIRNHPFMLFVHGYDAHTPYPKTGPLYRAGAPAYDGPLLELARNADLYEQIYDGWWYPDYHPGTSTLPGAGQGTGTSLATYRADPSVEKVRLSEADLKFLTGSYDMAAAHADAWVGVLLDALDDAGLTGHTVVIVLGDHGEDLMERGWFNHRYALNDVTLHVPLLMRVPGHPPGVVDTPTSLLDVAPTVLTLTGQSVPSDWSGLSLLDALPDRPIYSESPQGEVSIRTTDARLVSTPEALSGPFPAQPGPQDALYDDEGAEVRSWADAAALWPLLQAAIPEGAP